jgi:uncharacterized protein (DUF2147 family)
MRAIWIALVLGALSASSLAQTPAKVDAGPSGLWHTISDVDGKPRGVVQLQVVDGELRGVVAGTLRAGEDPGRICGRCTGARHNQPLSGMTILWGLRPDPRNSRQFVNGSVLDPDTGDIYSASLRLSSNGQSLELRGYFMLPLVGRSQTWMRAP